MAGVLPDWPVTDGLVEVEYISESGLCAPAIMFTSIAYGVAYAVDVAVDEVLYKVARSGTQGGYTILGIITLLDTLIEIHMVTSPVGGEAESGFGVTVNGETVDWFRYHEDALGDVSSAMILAISNHIELLSHNISYQHMMVFE